MAFVERRVFPRVSFNVEVNYKIQSSLKEIPDSMADSKNISEGGVCFVAFERLNPGTILNLRLLLPDSKQLIYVTGRVVWVEEFTVGNLNSSKAYETGIEFVFIREKDRERIKQFVLSKL